MKLTCDNCHEPIAEIDGNASFEVWDDEAKAAMKVHLPDCAANPENSSKRTGDVNFTAEMKAARRERVAKALYGLVYPTDTWDACEPGYKERYEKMAEIVITAYWGGTRER